MTYVYYDSLHESPGARNFQNIGSAALVLTPGDVATAMGIRKVRRMLYAFIEAIRATVESVEGFWKDVKHTRPSDVCESKNLKH